MITADTPLILVLYTERGRRGKSWADAQPRRCFRECASIEEAVDYALRAEGRLGADGDVYIQGWFDGRVQKLVSLVAR